eukprot:4094205-Amphidinium_carterae.1
MYAFRSNEWSHSSRRCVTVCARDEVGAVLVGFADEQILGRLGLGVTPLLLLHLYQYLHLKTLIGEPDLQIQVEGLHRPAFDRSGCLLAAASMETGPCTQIHLGRGSSISLFLQIGRNIFSCW